MSKKGMKYDYKKAYDKNLKPSARLHYLENARHDQDAGSPNKFMGGIAGALGGALGRSASAGGNFDRATYERLAQKRGIFSGLAQQMLDQNPVSAGAAPVAPVAPTVDMSGDPSLAAAGITGDGAMDQANPFEGKTFQITPANMMGNAKPMFSEQTQGMAQTAFGSGLERQMSMPNSGSVTQMKSIPEGDKGAGLRALDDSVVEQMGYDSATKMVSPLNDNHPQYFTGSREVTKKEFDSINKVKKAKTYFGGGQGLIPDALTGGKPTRQYLNESKLFNPTTTKEKVADLYDTKMKNAAGGNSITGDTNNKMYKYYEKRKNEIRPNRTDRY